MAAFVQLPTEDGAAVIEVWRPRSDVSPVTLGDTITELRDTIRTKLRPVIELAQQLRQELDVLQVKSAEVEFGFALTSKGSVFVVAMETEATFKVKLVFGGPSGETPRA